jgi:hypothetical protein
MTCLERGDKSATAPHEQTFKITAEAIAKSSEVLENRTTSADPLHVRYRHLVAMGFWWNVRFRQKRTF